MQDLSWDQESYTPLFLEAHQYGHATYVHHGTISFLRYPDHDFHLCRVRGLNIKVAFRCIGKALEHDLVVGIHDLPIHFAQYRMGTDHNLSLIHI